MISDVRQKERANKLPKPSGVYVFVCVCVCVCVVAVVVVVVVAAAVVVGAFKWACARVNSSGW